MKWLYRCDNYTGSLIHTGAITNTGLLIHTGAITNDKSKSVLYYIAEIIHRFPLQ